ncbi:RHS repeat domain-containing protein [Iodobacter arcticus]|uniref:RHS repeat domain-containing protein n=1 Tax=Iodobacter arcticus TaxID=590593 RepID=A0ABW2QSQ6_9NEIS
MFISTALPGKVLLGSIFLLSQAAFAAPIAPAAAASSVSALPTHATVVSRFKRYDALGRLEKEWDAKGQIYSYSYDANGNRQTSTDPLGRVTRYEYDALNRLSKSTDAAGKATLMSYDARDNLVQVTDPEGFKTSYSYNGFDDLIKLVSPDTGTSSYTRTASGQIQAYTDARKKTATYTYDDLGRVRSVDFGDGINAFTYDTSLVGKVASITNPSGSTSYRYDAQGNLAQAQHQIGKTLAKIGYTSNHLGQVETINYPSGIIISYLRNAAGQISGVQINGKPLLDQLVWSSHIGAQSWRWSNGQIWARVAANTGLLAGQSLADGNRVYTFDAVSNLRRIDDINAPQRSQEYSYDLLDRLNLAVSNNSSFNYFYDFNGNRSDQTVGAASTNYKHADNSNRLLSSSGANQATYTYDAAGNRANDNGWVLTYNNAGRLIKSTKAKVVVSYSYNALGQRVQKTSPTGTTLFVYDPQGRLLGEYLPSGQRVQETVWLGDIPVATVGSSRISYIWADHLGTPRQITDPTSKQILWRWDGEPFGNSLADEDPSKTGKTGKTFSYNLRFPGQYFDKETGKHYNYFRDYDPATGRYIESDPIGLAGGINTYGYVGGNPVGSTDKFGLSEDFGLTKPKYPYPIPVPLCLPPLCVIVPAPMPMPIPPMKIPSIEGCIQGAANWLDNLLNKSQTCEVVCNVQQIDVKAICPDRMYGSATAKTKPDACVAAQKDANSRIPRGCYKRHCHEVGGGK